jgi:phage/plasmid primase-like uncharacterized protein
MVDALSNFRDAIRAAGLEPPDYIEPGRLHRFPGNGKRPSNRAGWCLLFHDGLGGCFGDWSSGLSETWQARRDKPSRVILCEGWATGCTLAEDEPTARVLAAIDAGNLEPVAMAARRRWPSTEMVIAGDDDRLTVGNPGVTKAKAAAVASGALLALPQWPQDAPEHLTDFNDLAVWLAGGGA